MEGMQVRAILLAVTPVIRPVAVLAAVTTSEAAVDLAAIAIQCQGIQRLADHMKMLPPLP
jgi:hypothetical protein